MLYLSFILFFGLILTSSGKPTASAKRGIRIPFAQRTGTVNSRGQLDHNAVLAQTYSTKK